MDSSLDGYLSITKIDSIPFEAKLKFAKALTNIKTSVWEQTAMDWTTLKSAIHGDIAAFEEDKKQKEEVK